MPKLGEWCARKDSQVSKHSIISFDADPSKVAQGIDAVAAVVPGHYASASRVARILGRLGKPATAEYVRTKLPAGARSRSGDIGEILAIGFVGEFTGYNTGIVKLRWKDHREMPMRGDDILAIRVGGDSKVRYLKGEVKSRAYLGKTTVAEARQALVSNHGRPTPHALAFLSDRLFETGQTVLSDLIDEQIKARIAKGQTAHLMFVFSGNDATRLLADDLAAYTDTILQRAVGVRVAGHQDFIKQVYEQVLASGLDP